MREKSCCLPEKWYIMNILIATIKEWNINKAVEFKSIYENQHNVHIVSDKDMLNVELLEKIIPDYVFFPHWSYIIPPEIYENYNCIVFHMTDLPYGRGGSPLQNLIVRGHKTTKVSAIKVIKDLDAGPIYMKSNLTLEGNATEIYKRATDIIFDEMIPYILENNVEPVVQVGNPVVFKRRKPSDSEMHASFDLEKIYDYIRMLDADGYPHAFIRFGDKRLEFSNVEKEPGKLVAQVIIQGDYDE